jgi:hypothetical protein
MGYRIAVYPVEAIEVCGAAVRRLAEILMGSGDVPGESPDRLRFPELKRLLGWERFEALSAQGIMPTPPARRREARSARAIQGAPSR